MMKSWKDAKKELNISTEDAEMIALEKDIIRAIVDLREEKGLTQSELAEICNIRQPIISRIESAVHSPQIDSILKILTPLGYTLKIVPIEKTLS